MPTADFTDADTIRILVSTDNHVGYAEGDPIRGDDSWRSFDEVMEIAKDRDVDMVLLAGDLFHENKPSRKSMYQVQRSLRKNVYGDKPCELEFLSDASEQFGGTFNHVNYEDPDINVAIPVFSIHGNHDDPSGDGLAALDLLQMAGLLNYYGRTPEADNIQVRPVLLQKGKTKLALYGLSNVRDERLFRTFRDGNVKFFQPSTQKDDWFNIMSVHQNHYAHTETGYLPENFLPNFMDLVIWGHEHECKIDPSTNPETSFRVMQPGSSVATSLVQGEAETKHVAILTIKGKEFDSESIRLKTVRPFVMREVALSDSREMREVAMQDDSKPKITRYLDTIVEELIVEAKEQWHEAQIKAGVKRPDINACPLPLIRLRVEYTPPEGGTFNPDNPQRYSQRFQGRVANATDIVQFHRRRQTQRQIKAKPDMPEDEVMAQLAIDNVKIEKLVSEFLTAQSLTLLPQNNFSDAVGQFVDKDDNKAMNEFVTSSLETQIKDLLRSGEQDDDDDELDEEKIGEMMEQIKANMEAQFAKGELRQKKRRIKHKPKPKYWNSDAEGHWEDNVASVERDEEGNVIPLSEDSEGGSTFAKAKGKSTRGRGGKANGTTTRGGKTAAAQKAPAKARGKKQVASESEDDEDEDVIMLDDDDDDDDDDGSQLFVKPAPKKAPAKKPPTTSKAAPKSTRGGKASQAPSSARQSTLNFSQASQKTQGPGRAAASKARKLQEPSEDEISDDDDAFEPPPPTARSGRAGRR
ncbi:double-strand break repair protein mus-23-like [Teratosphaeria destructans]|uniref:Double-strand break repair protein n=1 Tax=Teratosphaeria destructans TaxID=418781 RepID=A0A9W7SR60_9PEZI|nr:double-strand break repair protein mus-23-like [Teratosphaeria destructans]